MSSSDSTNGLHPQRRARKAWLVIAGIVVLFTTFGVTWSMMRHSEQEWQQAVAAGRLERLNVRRLSASEQFERGLNARDGDKVVQSYAAAARWFRLAADQGYAPAQFELARLLQLGVGVPPNPEEARRYVEQAAKQGFPPAVTMAGILEVTRDGGDREQGLKWLKAAANFGDPWAQARLAVVYMDGQLENRDNFKALYWIERAHDIDPSNTEEVRLLAWQKIPPASRQLARTLVSTQVGHDVQPPAQLSD
jgi:TPR repeat protein